MRREIREIRCRRVRSGGDGPTRGVVERSGARWVSGRPHGSARGSGGFTLVELMVAVFLTAIGILAVSQIMTIATRHTTFAREETVATSLVQEIREKILSETFDDVRSIFDGIDTDNPGAIPLPAQTWATHVVDRLGSTGRGQIHVTTPDQDPDLLPGMLGIEVILSWYEGNSLVTLPMRFAIAKIGV